MKNTELLLKSVAGMLFLFMVVAASLFIPIGSFNYDLAWIYLLIFFGSSGFISLYLLVFNKRLLQSRLVAGPLGETRPKQKWIQSIAGIAFILIFVVSSFDHKAQWSKISVTLSHIADWICILSFIFLFFVFKQNSFLSATIKTQKDQQVISTGLYGIVRHPMYSSALILIFSTPIALASYWGLIPSFVLNVAIYFRAIDEEEELKNSLPGYKEYCKMVRYRFIPFVI